jgi:hypothetical protein
MGSLSFPRSGITAIKLSVVLLKFLPFVLRYRSMNGRNFGGFRVDPFTPFDAAQDRLRYLRANGSTLNLMAVTLQRGNAVLSWPL